MKKMGERRGWSHDVGTQTREGAVRRCHKWVYLSLLYDIDYLNLRNRSTNGIGRPTFSTEMAIRGLPSFYISFSLSSSFFLQFRRIFIVASSRRSNHLSKDTIVQHCVGWDPEGLCWFPVCLYIFPLKVEYKCDGKCQIAREQKIMKRTFAALLTANHYAPSLNGFFEEFTGIEKRELKREKDN